MNNLCVLAYNLGPISNDDDNDDTHFVFLLTSLFLTHTHPTMFAAMCKESCSNWRKETNEYCSFFPVFSLKTTKHIYRQIRRGRESERMSSIVTDRISARHNYRGFCYCNFVPTDTDSHRTKIIATKRIKTNRKTKRYTYFFLTTTSTAYHINTYVCFGSTEKISLEIINFRCWHLTFFRCFSVLIVSLSTKLRLMKK